MNALLDETPQQEGAQLSRPRSAADRRVAFTTSTNRMMGYIQGGMPRNRLRMPSVSQTRTNSDIQNRQAISPKSSAPAQAALSLMAEARAVAGLMAMARPCPFDVSPDFVGYFKTNSSIQNKSAISPKPSAPAPSRIVIMAKARANRPG